MWICWGNAFSLKLDNCNRKERRKQAIQPVCVWMGKQYTACVDGET